MSVLHGTRDFHFRLEYIVDGVKDNPDLHFRAMVMKRKKDGHKEDKILKRYTLNSESVDKYFQEIVDLCDKEKARFYINPTAKSYKDIAFDVMTKTAESIQYQNYEFVKRLYDSVADANTGVREHRKWIMDIDFKNEVCTPESCSSAIRDLFGYYDEKNLNYLIHDTKNGAHFIVEPHYSEPRKLEKIFEGSGYSYEIKTNAYTLLYWG